MNCGSGSGVGGRRNPNVLSQIFTSLIIVNFELLVRVVKPIEITVLNPIFAEFLLDAIIELSIKRSCHEEH